MDLSTLHIITLICNVLAFIPAIVFHEFMHGFAAFLLGDRTAKAQGRVTLNPIKHIDPFGTVILPALLMVMGGPVFGYAKPVPYNPGNFKNPRMGDLVVGLAGPCGNLLLAIIASIVFLAMGSFINSASSPVLLIIYAVYLPLLVLINLYLMFFNLIPIPPLDGSSIFALVVPRKYLPQYYRIQQYALPIFLVVLFLLPYLFDVNIIGLYLDVTAGSLASLLLGL